MTMPPLQMASIRARAWHLDQMARFILLGSAIKKAVNLLLISDLPVPLTVGKHFCPLLLSTITRNQAQGDLNPLQWQRTALSMLPGLTAEKSLPLQVINRGRERMAVHPHILHGLWMAARHLKKISNWMTMPAPAAGQQ